MDISYIKYFTDDMVDSIPPTEVSKLLKEVIASLRSEEFVDGSVPTETVPVEKIEPPLTPVADAVPNMYADQVDENTTLDEALAIVGKPSNFTKKMREADKKEMAARRKKKSGVKKTVTAGKVKYEGVSYVKSADSYAFRAKIEGRSKAVMNNKNPIHIAVVRDIWMEAVNEDCEKNYDKFEEVGEYMMALSGEQLEAIETQVNKWVARRDNEHNGEGKDEA